MTAVTLAVVAMGGAAAQETPSATVEVETPQAQLGSGEVDSYVAYALERHPAMRAAFLRWRAAVHSIARARSLPEPTLHFAVFLRSVETRVGPQQARVRLEQSLPWPTGPAASGRAATAEARAAKAQVDAVAVAVVERVEAAYWGLWEIRRTRTLHREHQQVLEALSDTVSARIEVGTASLADLQQINLSRARLEDRLLSLDASERGAVAALRATVGLASTEPTPTESQPEVALPGELDDALVVAALTHPRVEALGARAEAATATAASRGAQRLPQLTLGADWIVTGPARDPDLAGSGRDAVSAGLGITIPLWQGAYAHDVSAARSEAAALRADQKTAGDQAVAELHGALARVRDTARRAEVVSSTLLPQADGAYASVLGSYVVGRGAVAQTLLSQQDLLDLGVELARARADHHRAWARLDRLCGREVARTSSLVWPPTQDSP